MVYFIIQIDYPSVRKIAPLENPCILKTRNQVLFLRDTKEGNIPSLCRNIEHNKETNKVKFHPKNIGKFCHYQIFFYFESLLN